MDTFYLPIHQLGPFPFLAIINNANVNINLQVFVWMYRFQFLWVYT